MLKSLSLADKSNAAHVFAHRLVICVISHKLVVLNVHLKIFHHLILFHLFLQGFGFLLILSSKLETGLETLQMPSAIVSENRKTKGNCMIMMTNMKTTNLL